MHKLTQQREALLAKKQELTEIINHQNILNQEINAQRNNEKALKQSLGQEYVQLQEQKRQNQAEVKRAEVEAERAVVEANQRQMEEEYQRRKGQVEAQRREVQQELAERERIR